MFVPAETSADLKLRFCLLLQADATLLMKLFKGILCF